MYFFETMDRWSLTILKAFNRFPLATFSGVMVSIILSILIELGGVDNNVMVLYLYKIVFVLTLGVVLFPALHFLHRKIWLKLVGMLLLVLYYYLLPQTWNEIVVLRHLLLILALFLMFFWAPFIDTSISNKNIWEWTQNILLILFATVLLTVTFYLIVSTTLYSLKELFQINLEEKRYLQTAVLVLGFFSVNFFFAHLPKYIVLLQKNKYSKIGSVFTKYVLTPSFFIYTIILFSYIFKLIYTQNLNRASFDTIGIIYTIIAIVTYMFWTPLWENEVNVKFRTFLWSSLLFLSFLFSLSLWFRTESNSVETFYLMGLFSLWLFIVSLYFLLVESASYKWLFFSLSLFIIVFQSEYLINFLSQLLTTYNSYKL